jgi:hypothetical protein
MNDDKPIIQEESQLVSEPAQPIIPAPCCPHTNIASRRLLTCRTCGEEFIDQLPPGDFVLMPKPDYDAYLAMKHEQDEIALFLRNNYQEEIGKGQHSGVPLSQILARYLSVERSVHNATGFFSKFFKVGGKTN